MQGCTNAPAEMDDVQGSQSKERQEVLDIIVVVLHIARLVVREVTLFVGVVESGARRHKGLNKEPIGIVAKVKVFVLAGLHKSRKHIEGHGALCTQKDILVAQALVEEDLVPTAIIGLAHKDSLDHDRNRRRFRTRKVEDEKV